MCFHLCFCLLLNIRLSCNIIYKPDSKKRQILFGVWSYIDRQINTWRNCPTNLLRSDLVLKSSGVATLQSPTHSTQTVFNYINVLYHIIDTFDLIYLHLFPHAHAASFKKNTFCLNQHYFLISKNKPIQASTFRQNPIFWKYVQNKVNVWQDIFLNYTGISSWHLKLF